MTKTLEHKKKVWDHILKFAPLEEHCENIRALKYGKKTLFDAVYEYVTDGCCAVYDNEVNELLYDLGWDIDNDQDQNWKTYRFVVTNELIGNAK